MIAMGFLLMGDYGDVIVPQTLLIGQVLLSVSALLTIVTGGEYLTKGIKEIIKLEQKGS
jgi:cardiolipin synthase